MTAPPVVLDVYTCKHVLLPLPQDIRAHKVSATQAKTQATSQLPVSTSSPPEAQSQSLPRQTYVTEFRQPLQVQSHLEMPGILVQLGHIQCT